MLSLLAACGAAVPPLPSEGGPAWVEIRSEHFILWTNASRQHGRALVREMEQRRQVMVRAMRFAPQRGRIFAVALRSERELEAFFPSSVAAVAWPSLDLSLPAGIALQADSPEREQSWILNHELAHAISFGLLKRQPRWLGEGLATYFETAEFDADSPTVQLGVPRRDQAVRLRKAGAMPVAALFACNDASCSRNEDFYASSWLLFSHLLNNRFDAFAWYLKRLQELPMDQRMRAWEEAFPNLSLSELDRELTLLIKSFELAVPRIPVPVQTSPTAERTLGDADALAVRSLLYIVGSQGVAALTAAKAALRADHTHTLAWGVLDALHQPPSLGQARAVVAAHPDDWRGWRMLAASLEPGAERTQATERFCTLASSDGISCERE